MALEEKIASLSPEHQIQVEEYIDFLLSRSKKISREEDFPGFGEQLDGDASDNGYPDVPVVSSSASSSRVKERAKPSEIILAEERAPANEASDYVDFADINSRFGHTPKDEDDQKGPGRLRRFLDWM